jgi:hypothetical protein
VLRLLRSDLSQREIGEALHVSFNTVKTHAKSIYRKLDVATRDDAVSRARTLELLWRSLRARSRLRPTRARGPGDLSEPVLPFAVQFCHVPSTALLADRGWCSNLIQGAGP